MLAGYLAGILILDQPGLVEHRLHSGLGIADHRAIVITPPVSFLLPSVLLSMDMSIFLP